MADDAGRLLRVVGASEHNLHDVDVTFGPGLTAVVGVSGSGKSSLAFDVVYAEARRRFVEALGRSAGSARVPAAQVRSIEGLGPAVAVAQNVLNLNPRSTVASSVGLHPFFRILWSKAAEVSCPRCGIGVQAVSREERLAWALDRLDVEGPMDVEVALVRGLVGSHARLLVGLGTGFGPIVVDGAPWDGEPLDPTTAHDVVVGAGRLEPGMGAAEVRALLDAADGLGSHELRVGGEPVLRAPICPQCSGWVAPLEPTAFRDGGPDTSSHRLAGLTLPELLALPVAAVLPFVEALPDDRRTDRLRDELVRRLRPLLDLGLGHLELDRPMPSLSRGESQRTRLAVVLAGRLEDLLHVLDEPTVGLHHTDLSRLLEALAELPGPVLMVEHDRTAIALADDVVEIGPGGGALGGRLVFQGPPAALWEADTPSGRGFSKDLPVRAERRVLRDDRIRIAGASARNLAEVDCELPLGALTVVTGPSGAGKTTLSREVLLASLHAGGPVGCTGFEAPKLRAIAVDQAPLGNNPRSNPATYVKVFDRIRDLFAEATGRSASDFTFNRAEGACPACEGMGATEIALRYLAPVWVTCETCEGKRYKPEVLEAQWAGRSIADVLDTTVDEACALFADHRPIAKVLDALHEVGLGYVALGQPSPSLSGGEAQRVRLARELARAKAGDLVLLDEPTTGLHPADLARLVGALDRLTDAGCTVVVVEHQADVIAAADWRIDLGPGGGPAGGRLVAMGTDVPVERAAAEPRTAPRDRPRSADAISVRGARAHNLQGVDVDLAKRAFTVVTGVSGSGKSSLVHDVLAAEATRRLLECLSVYERESVREGPEAPVDSLTGLGPTLIVDGESTITSSRAGLLATVARAADLDRLVAIVLARAGERTCLHCGGTNVRRASAAPESRWRCEDCGEGAVPIEPRQLVGAPTSLCPSCLATGSTRRFVPERLLRDPTKPLCGAFGSGNTLVGYFCDEKLSGSSALRFVAERHGFDPRATPWQDMTEDARNAFLFGDPEPYPVRADPDGRVRIAWGFGADAGEEGVWRFRGLDLWMSGPGDHAGPWDVVRCTACDGRRLRPEFLAIRLAGRDRTDLFTSSLVDVEDVLRSMDEPVDRFAADARSTALHRMRFLREVGLGYLHLDRRVWTLSAGEAQRITLASVLGSGLVGTTILLDEPSRGLHPSEVDALAATLHELRDLGNTVVAVEHDPALIRAADALVEIGPGSGAAGGQLVDVASAGSVTRAVLEGRVAIPRRWPRRTPTGWMDVRGVRTHNLRGVDLRLPLGVQVGVCGISGSGKSSLVVDTIARGLAKPTTDGPSIEDAVHEGIDGAPSRVVVADQARTDIVSPGLFLGLVDAVRKAFAAGETALEQGLTAKDLRYGCDACKGRGTWREGMWFLPSVSQACDACHGTGYRREVADLVERGRTLAEIEGLSLAALVDEWGDLDVVRRAGGAALQLGLGYLVVRQPGWSLSGGEAQRLKLSKALARPAKGGSLYVLDEPTVGLQATDVVVLARALDAVVDGANSLLVVEHDPMLLAACDWVVELGPGAGPHGGTVVFEGTPEELATASTATAPFVREVLG